MATIRKRGNRWQAQVRRKGCAPVSRSFLLKSDAQAWARASELEADRGGQPAQRERHESLTVGSLLLRYRDEVIPKKRGAVTETIAVNAFLRHDLAKVPLAVVSPSHVAAYRDERLKVVRPSTLNRQLDIFRHAFEVAAKEWGYPIATNPFRCVARAKNGVSRARRLSADEEARLLHACGECRQPYLKLMVRLALETGMRRGELLQAEWSDVNFGTRTLHLPLTKNGHPRTIPLSPGALALLTSLRDLPAESRRVVPISLDAMRMSWKRAVKRAGLKDLHFHDLRHEAISRFFEMGLNVPEVAMISGHRDPRMLFRYTHPRAEVVAKKLAASTT